MGHSYAEMDPVGYKQQQERIQRENDLRLKFEEVPLSELAVKDLNPLLRLSGFDVHQRARDTDLLYLEGRFEQIQEKMNPKPRQTYDQPESTWQSLYGNGEQYPQDFEVAKGEEWLLDQNPFANELPPEDWHTTRQGE